MRPQRVLAAVLVTLIALAASAGAAVAASHRTADLWITKSDGQTTVTPGASVTYTLSVGGSGPNAALGAAVVDRLPATLTGATWTCLGSAGGRCLPKSGAGDVLAILILPRVDSGATITLTATVAADLGGPLSNTATVRGLPGIVDPDPTNNSATDTDELPPPLPPLALLDDFNRANSTTLGADWSQTTLLGSAALRVNTNQAFCPDTGIFCIEPGQAIWNGADNVFGANQGAAFTFADSPLDGTSLLLKASGGTLAFPANLLRVRYESGAVVVDTTTNQGLTDTIRATFSATIAAGDTLSAVAYDTGRVDVFATSGGSTTQIGTVTIPTAGVGSWIHGASGGGIGIVLPSGARVDDFSGGTVP